MGVGGRIGGAAQLFGGSAWEDRGDDGSGVLGASPQSAGVVDAARERHPLVLRNLVHDVGLALWLFLPWEPRRRKAGGEVGTPGRPERRRFREDVRAVALALVFVLALAALADFADAAGRTTRDPVFNVWGLHVLATRLFVEVAALFLIAVVAGRVDRLAALLSGLMALEIIAAVIAPLLDEAHAVAATAFGAVCFVVLARIVWRELALSAPRRLLAALAAGTMAWGLVAALPGISLFRAPPDRARAPSLDIERTYVRQERLVRQAVEAVRPSVPDEEEIYFVGFASYDDQNVFENETRHVAALFREQFDAGDRSVLLVNSRKTVKELPFANGHNLAAVLRGVAGKMGPEDILFLHMTSHGSSDHKFTVDFANLRLHDLSAAELGRIIDGAALPWRVVVVAACYSGGYIEPLKSPRTMVITASRADRTSFGCKHGREYTYFGEAFYRDSLAGADFVTAFENARDIVVAREGREELTPSEPQIWIGAEMAGKLGVPASASSEAELSTSEPAQPEAPPIAAVESS